MTTIPLIEAALAGPNASPLPIYEWDTENGVRIDVGYTSAQSPALAAGCYMLTNDVPCVIAVGVNPTATMTGASQPILSPATSVLKVRDGEKLAVKRYGDTDGYLWLVPLKEVS